MNAERRTQNEESRKGGFLLRSKFCVLRSAFFGLLALVCLTCTARREPKAVVRFWGLGREGEVVAQLVPEFERRNPGIRVKVQQIPWTAAHEKLLTAVVGEATPDVAQMGNTWIPEFVAVGSLEDLTPWIARSRTVVPDAYFPGIWATNVVDGRPYGVPWYVDTRVLFYRSDLLAAVGFPGGPRTWSQWMEACARLKGRVRYPMLMPTNEWEPPTMMALARGASLLRGEGRHGAFRDPRFASAFTFYVEMFRRGFAPAVSNSQVANLYQQFAENDFAMYITGPWNVGEFRRRLPPHMQDKWMTAAMPAPDGVPFPGRSFAGGAGLVMFRASERKEAAWKFIEFLSEPGQQIHFYDLTGDLPTRMAAWDAPALSGDRHFAAFRQQLDHIAAMPRVPEWEQIATVIWEHGDAAARGQMTIPQALAALDRKTGDILAKRRWVLARKTPSRTTP